MTDEELLVELHSGVSLAFEELYVGHRVGLFSCILNQVREKAVAEDILQGIWLKLTMITGDLVERIEQQAEVFSLAAYLYRMANNAVIDHHRQSDRLTSLEDGDALIHPDAVPPERVASRDELLRCIALRLEKIRLKKQQAFWQTRDALMTYEDVATAAGVAAETVKSWVRDVLKAIRPCREEYDNV